MTHLQLITSGGGPRAETPGNPDGHVTCACGEAWFTLVEHDGATPAAIALQEDGAIAGATGELACVSCGRRRHVATRSSLHGMTRRT